MWVLLSFYIYFKVFFVCLRYWCPIEHRSSRASKLKMWASKNKYHWSKLTNVVVTSTDDCTLTVDTHKGGSRHIPTHTRLQTLKTHILEHKVSSTVQPLLCLVPFIEAVWWRGTKFDHAFSLDWSPPYLEGLFVAVSLHSCLCHAPRRRRERD